MHGIYVLFDMLWLGMSAAKENIIKTRAGTNGPKCAVFWPEECCFWSCFLFRKNGGNNMSDYDAVGAAIGVLRICKILEKPAVIAVDERHTLANRLIDRFRDNGFGYDFISPPDALEGLSKRTLVVIVDTHDAGLH